MLLGHNDNNVEDTNMRVTIAFNHFGPGLIERMPRYIVDTYYQSYQFNLIELVNADVDNDVAE